MSTYYMDGAEWRMFNDGTWGADWAYGHIGPNEYRPDRLRVSIDAGWETESLYLDEEDVNVLMDLLHKAKMEMGWS